MNFVKTTVQKLCDLPWPDFRDLFSWPSGGSTIHADNPNLLLQKLLMREVSLVAYVTAETILLVDSFVFNPNSTPNDSATPVTPLTSLGCSKPVSTGCGSSFPMKPLRWKVKNPSG